jgi:hypothetical protein
MNEAFESDYDKAFCSITRVAKACSEIIQTLHTVATYRQPQWLPHLPQMERVILRFQKQCEGELSRLSEWSDGFHQKDMAKNVGRKFSELCSWGSRMIQ